VAVGINQTMTAQDILEGRMIVKVGYAPSRPAEFIILEFKQMQQKS
jgi:phage tail sheath protein FI